MYSNINIAMPFDVCYGDGHKTMPTAVQRSSCNGKWNERERENGRERGELQEQEKKTRLGMGKGRGRVGEDQCSRSNGVIFIGLLLFRFTDKLLMSRHAHTHTHILTHTSARKMQCYKFIIYVALSFGRA